MFEYTGNRSKVPIEGAEKIHGFFLLQRSCLPGGSSQGPFGHQPSGLLVWQSLLWLLPPFPFTGETNSWSLEA